MRRASMEFDKIIAWVLGIVLALVILFFITTQLRADGGGLMGEVLEAFRNLG